MFPTTEQVNVKMANEARGQVGRSTSGTDRSDCAFEPAQPGLRDRIRLDWARAQRESWKEGRLAELQYLLDKHPEVARILELLDAVK